LRVNKRKGRATAFQAEERGVRFSWPAPVSAHPVSVGGFGCKSRLTQVALFHRFRAGART